MMLKPDALKRGLAGAIIARVEQKGYRIAQMKMMQLGDTVLREHYAHLADKPFYPSLEEFMMSGPVVGMVVEGEGCIAGMRLLMGPTRFEDAQPGTIRGDYARSTQENLVHGSDSAETAEAEIERFFGADQLF